MPEPLASGAACGPKHVQRDSVITVPPAQDSALDSLVAARHAVLADLARDPPPGAGAAAADFLRRDSAGDGATGAPRREAALLDPLLQARRLVRHPEKP